jgi:hypothetical protein
VSILGVIALCVWWKTGSHTHTKAIKENPIHKHPYAAVQVKPCTESCKPAHYVSKKVYLISELEHLPLESCDRIDSCNCKFIHFNDRRHQDDRRADSIVMQDIFDAKEHRDLKIRGRRTTDFVGIQ